MLNHTATIRSTELLARLGIEDLDLILKERRLRWYGHVIRSNGAVKTAFDIQVNGKESRQFIDKTTHRHVFWRQFIDTIEDNSLTLFEDNSSTHLFEYNLQS